LDEDRRPSRAVSLVGDALDRRRVVALARAAVDCTLNVVLGHRGVAGLLHGETEGGVGVDGAAAITCRDRDRARKFGEELAALRVRGALLVLDRRPLRVT